jgi:ketosteroid isomerase-like protein
MKSTSEAQNVGEPYFEAYIRRDWDKFESLLHVHAVWSDPTAQQLFGTERPSGKKEVAAHLRRTFAGITHMKAHVKRALFSSNFAVFEAELDWSVAVRNGESVEVKGAPFVVVLRIEDGRVIEHTDYADYRSFISEFHRKVSK